MHGLFAESQLHKYPLPLLSESLRVSEGVLRICLIPNDVLGYELYHNAVHLQGYAWDSRGVQVYIFSPLHRSGFAYRY